ncbi:MAG: sugar O-acetyltransferase [Balneolales bacterium]
MKTEKQKMLDGELYNPYDAVLSAERLRCRELCRLFNDSREDQEIERKRILSDLFGEQEDVMIQPPFFCDYGSNITLGLNVFFNFNCVLLDVMKIKIGDNGLFGPAVHIYTATHPLSAVKRRLGLELASPVSIGSDVWVGGNSVICPGVTIGDRSVIGAGSIVTKDIPADVFAAGNPCKIIRTIQE